MAKPKPLDFAHFEGVEPTGPEERTTHEAQCHCGAIAYSVTLKWPFPKNPINNCNCSICQHNGYLLVYPTRKDVVFHTGFEDLASYEFHTKKKSHKFCKNCGSSLYIDFQRPQQGVTDPDKDLLAVNVRHFKDVDLEKMEYTFFDGKKLL